MTMHVEVFRRLRRHWLSAVGFLVPLAFYLLGALVLHIPELYQHVLLTLTAVMGIHILDRLFLIKDTEEALDRLVSDIQLNIKDQTTSLISSSKTLEAMDRCGVVQSYPSRVEAAAHMRDDLASRANSKVLLIGISLNDFVQGMDPTLSDAWSTIEAFVRGRTPIDHPERGLEIRVLMIDPRCLGARLRSDSESRTQTALASRLDTDVNAAAKALRNLMLEAKHSKTGVSFECRLYRLPPILFLCWVDTACYVQQYHFWSSRDNRTPIPVLKYRKRAPSQMTYPYHAEMEHHFEWIWEHASIPLVDYLDGHEVGNDEGLGQCGVANIYTDPIKARERIIFLLQNARAKVSIQGISLSSFFKPGALRQAIAHLLETEKAEVEVLLLDPDSDQAKYRSYREQLFISEDEPYDSYVAEGKHESSELYTDTRRTIEHIGHMIDLIRHRKPADWQPRVRVGLYSSAPACFVLRIDDKVLAEQYHYGKVARQTRSILGKEMPLFEYREQPSPLYESDSDPLRRPFDLLIDHFQYALARARRVEFGSPSPSRHEAGSG